MQAIALPTISALRPEGRLERERARVSDLQIRTDVRLCERRCRRVRLGNFRFPRGQAEVASASSFTALSSKAQLWAFPGRREMM